MEMRPSQHRPYWLRAGSGDMARLLLIALLVLGALFYLQRAFQFFLYDDEGCYAYAGWRISLGEVPYRDFLTSQMPAFLYWGGLLVRLFGRSYVALRLVTMLAMLVAGYLLYAANRELFGPAEGLVSLAFFLVEPNAFHSGRFFQSEAYMLLFALAGVYWFVVSDKRDRPRYACLAGLFFGFSTLNKLFGLLPLAGCMLYLVYAGWRERRPWRQVLRQALALSLPVLLVVGTVALIFSRITPQFYRSILEHHTLQGAGMPLAQRIHKALDFCRGYAQGQPLAIALALLGAGYALWKRPALSSFWVWQLPTVLAFSALSRSLMTRHMTYLAPATTSLLGIALCSLTKRRWPWRVLAAALAVATVYPWLVKDATRAAWEEHDSTRLAAYVRELASPDEIVLADYPGINFLAGRRSTYLAAELSEVGADSGEIRGALLAEEIERRNVALVIIHTAGNAHQLIGMADYPEFRRYVQAHFALVDKFQCSYQQLEIYSRDDTIPLRPDVSYHGEIALTGVRLPAAAVASGATLAVDTRWQARQPMSHDYLLSLRLADATGHIWTQADQRLEELFTREESHVGDVCRVLPTSLWEPGQVVFVKGELPVPPTVPSGSYDLVAKLYDLNSGFAVAADAGSDPVVATVRVASGAPPDPATLPLSATLRLPLAPGVELLGTGPLPASVRVGRELAVALFWRATGPAPGDYRLQLSLAQGDTVRQRWPTDLVAGFPTDNWREGDILLGHYVLPVPGDLPAGEYTLQVAAEDGQGKPLGQALAIGSLRLAPPADAEALRKRIAHPLAGVSFAGRIGFLGYDLSAEALAPGETLSLTLYWQCLAPLANDYKVFVHLLDAEGRKQGQRDAMPNGGQTPTSTWVVGDLLADRYEVPVEATAPAGALRIDIGFYDPVNGERLSVYRDGRPAGEDHIPLPTAITVARP